MQNIEEAEVRENGSVCIRYYFGKAVTIPARVMEECIILSKYGKV